MAEKAAPSADPAPTAEQVQKALEARRQELDSALGREKEISSSVSALDRERGEINQRLLEAGSRIKSAETSLTGIEDKLGALEAQEAHIRGSLAQRHGEIAKLLSALQRMGRNPPPVIVTEREDALAMVRSAMLLAAAFPGMKTKALEIAEKLDGLVQLTTQSRTERDNLRAETARLGDLKTQLATLLEQKRKSISDQQAELVRVRETAKEMARSVADLNELIQSLDKTVEQNTGLGAYDAALKAAAAAPAAVAPPGSPSSSPAPVEAGAANDTPSVVAMLPPETGRNNSVVELAPTAGSVVPGNTARLQPAIEFQLAKAKLPLPASGRRVLAFGERTQYGSTSKGLVLETRSGAQVTSPCDGWVVYAGEFRSYGKLLIINGGGGYHVVLAGLSHIDVEPGQFVLAAEPVGTMSKTDQRGTSDGASSAPVLYIEFRKDGQPINPDPWWVETTQKAQG